MSQRTLGRILLIPGLCAVTVTAVPCACGLCGRVNGHAVAVAAKQEL